MTKTKRRMIDADALLKRIHEPSPRGIYGEFVRCDIERVVNELLKSDSSCDFRNPGWEERAKGND